MAKQSKITEQIITTSFVDKKTGKKVRVIPGPKMHRTIEQLLKNYPIIDGHRKHRIEFPVQVTEDMKQKHPYPEFLTIGKFMTVNVELNGYSMKLTPVMLDTMEYAQKCCNGHNTWLGFTKEETDLIIHYSMNNV